jgi:hypothetical protein
MPETLTGKYMRADIQPSEPRKRTRDYLVSEKKTGGQLGVIRWYGPWRGYCFFPSWDVVFDGGCLTQIVDWLVTLNAAHKAARNGATEGKT